MRDMARNFETYSDEEESFVDIDTRPEGPVGQGQNSSRGDCVEEMSEMVVSSRSEAAITGLTPKHIRSPFLAVHPSRVVGIVMVSCHRGWTSAECYSKLLTSSQVSIIDYAPFQRSKPSEAMDRDCMCLMLLTYSRLAGTWALLEQPSRIEGDVNRHNAAGIPQNLKSSSRLFASIGYPSPLSNRRYAIVLLQADHRAGHAGGASSQVTRCS